MKTLCSEVLKALAGKSLVTAESCTGGMIGSALTAIEGSSSVYKGGVICYSNWVKENILKVDPDTLAQKGAVSEAVAEQMARGVRRELQADVAVSVTGLAGPGGDDFGNPVGTVFIGYCDESVCEVQKYFFAGVRDAVRLQAVEAALNLILKHK